MLKQSFYYSCVGLALVTIMVLLMLPIPPLNQDKSTKQTNNSMPTHPDARISSLSEASAVKPRLSKGEEEMNLNWLKTDDTMVNGKSSANIKYQEGFISVRASIKPGFKFAWAGAAAVMDSEAGGQPKAAVLDTLSFSVRGTPGTYRVMLFSESNNRIPAFQTFNVNREWQRLDFSSNSFTQFNNLRFIGFAIVAGPEVGEFEFELDDVKLQVK